jgi:hypothetical protein
LSDVDVVGRDNTGESGRDVERGDPGNEAEIGADCSHVATALVDEVRCALAALDAGRVDLSRAALLRVLKRLSADT